MLFKLMACMAVVVHMVAAEYFSISFHHDVWH